MPRHHCDLATLPDRYDLSEVNGDGTSSSLSRSLSGEGWYVGQTDTRRGIPDGIGEGLRRAFPLPASGAFQNLLEALDRVDAQNSAPGKRDVRGKDL